MPETPTINHGLDEWAAKLIELGEATAKNSRLVEDLRGNKAETVRMLTKLTLPRFASVEYDTLSFLAEPDIAFRSINTALLYVSMGDAANTLRRQRNFNLTRTTALEFARDVYKSPSGEDHAPGFELRGAHFHTGYYEFALIHRRPNSPLQPIFIDYSQKKPFVFDEP